MEINRSVRVSSSVLFVPNLAATRACTSMFSCSARALNPASVFASAKASLPVVALIFVGGSTPSSISLRANFSLDRRVSRSALALAIKASLRSTTSMRCCSNNGRSSSSVGCVYIRKVKSISLSSCFLKDDMRMLNRSYVSFTSLIQYFPY